MRSAPRGVPILWLHGVCGTGSYWMGAFHESPGLECTNYWDAESIGINHIIQYCAMRFAWRWRCCVTLPGIQQYSSEDVCACMPATTTACVHVGYGPGCYRLVFAATQYRCLT